MMTPLAVEFLTPPPPFPPEFRAALRAVWDSIDAAVWLDLIRPARVLIEGEAYQPHEDGDWCFVTPCLHIDGDKWREHVWTKRCCAPDEARCWFSEVVDLVAWHPATPGRWARRTGDASMLGAIDEGAALRVWRTPLSWLRGGGEGVCFLTSEQGIIAEALRAASEVIAEDGRHAAELRRICEQPAAPRIRVAA